MMTELSCFFHRVNNAANVRRRRKNIKSRRTFNKNSCDLLTAIKHTKIHVANFIISDKKKNWSIGGALRQQGLLIIVVEIIRKINMNFEQKIKATYKEVTENSDASSKYLKTEF